MEKSVNIILMSDRELDEILADLAYINRAIKGDKTPTVYRRLRKLKKMGILTVDKGSVRLTTNPLLAASFEVKDCTISIKDFALLHQNGELYVVSSICSSICERCPRLQVCSQILRNVFNELGICVARGLTPVEVVRFTINECLSGSRLIKLTVNLRHHNHKQSDEGKYIIVNNGKNKSNHKAP